jgi:hypothetical protein
MCAPATLVVLDCYEGNATSVVVHYMAYVHDHSHTKETAETHAHTLTESDEEAMQQSSENNLSKRKQNGQKKKANSCSNLAERKKN